MNEYLKKVLIVSTSALMFLSAGAGINNVQARRYHYRYHRRANHNKYGYWKHYRRHGRTHSYFVRYKTGYYHNGHWIRYHHNSGTSSTVSASRAARYIPRHRRRHGRSLFRLHKRTHRHSHSHFHVKFRKISGPSDDNTDNHTTANIDNTDDSSDATTPTYIYSSNDLDEARQQMINDINQDRIQNGLSPVQENPLMEEIADERAKQTAKDFTHYDASNNNTPYELEDAKKLGIQFGKGYYIFTENLAGGYGNTMRQQANYGNDQMMYHDASSNWGHRKNILYPDWRIVGVGVASFPKSSEYYGDLAFAEDFATYATKGNNNGIYSSSDVPERNGSYDPYSWAYNHGNN